MLQVMLTGSVVLSLLVLDEVTTSVLKTSTLSVTSDMTTKG